MTMKFIFSLMLAAVLAVSLAGCGVVADLAASASPKNKTSQSVPENTSISAPVQQENEAA